MCHRWIILIYVLNIHLRSIISQHYNHRYYEPVLEQYDDDEDPDEYYETPEYFNRRSGRYRKLERIHDTEECLCSCDECIIKPKDCCTEFCKYCHTPDTPNLSQYPEQLNQNQENKVVFVPYPVPLIVPNVANTNAPNLEEHQTPRQTSETVVTTNVAIETTTTTVAPTTTTTTVTPTSTTTMKTTMATTTTEALTTAGEVLRAKSVDVSMLSRHRKLKQLNPAVRRKKPAWVPKYGIVPIPDHLAAKLMTQLTEVRALKARKL